MPVYVVTAEKPNSKGAIRRTQRRVEAESVHDAERRAATAFPPGSTIIDVSRDAAELEHRKILAHY